VFELFDCYQPSVIVCIVQLSNDGRSPMKDSHSARSQSSDHGIKIHNIGRLLINTLIFTHVNMHNKIEPSLAFRTVDYRGIKSFLWPLDYPAFSLPALSSVVPLTCSYCIFHMSPDSTYYSSLYTIYYHMLIFLLQFQSQQFELRPALAY